MNYPKYLVNYDSYEVLKVNVDGTKTMYHYQRQDITYKHNSLEYLNNPIIRFTNNNSIYHNKNQLRKYISDLHKPMYFLDISTKNKKLTYDQKFNRLITLNNKRHIENTT